MGDHVVRVSEIPAASKPKGFGPFTSAVSATAILSLVVVMSVLYLGSM